MQGTFLHFCKLLSKLLSLQNAKAIKIIGLVKTIVMRSVKTRRMSQNAKLSFWSHFKAKSELFPELFKFCLYDIHIQSYN